MALWKMVFILNSETYVTKYLMNFKEPEPETYEVSHVPHWEALSRLDV